MLVRTVATSLCLALAAGCAAPTVSEDPTTASEQDLTGLRAGRYAVASAPLSGSYVESLVIGPGKKVELEYVRVRTSPVSVWTPWFTTRDEQRLSLQGTYTTFAGKPGETLISFDVTDTGIDHLIYSLKVDGTSIELKAVGGSAFVLRPSNDAPATTDARVLTCTGRSFDAVITLDQAQRRRGTMTVKRNAGADANDPPSISFTVAYTGDTGVDDYMAFVGTDAKSNDYEFALRKSDLAKTSGPTAQVGVAFTRDMVSYGVHHTLACTIGKP
jgi:hypothetical protein